MDTNQWKMLGASVILVAGGIVSIVASEKKHKKQRTEIQIEEQKQLKAIKTAKYKTLRRLRKDKLALKGLDAVIDEFKFQEIVARYED
jgi:hypothetical protein